MPELEKYRRLLQRLSEFWIRYGVAEWAVDVESWKCDIERDETRTDPELLRRNLQRTISAFGGMGSINDLTLQRSLGHNVPVDTEEVAVINKEKAKLLASLYEEAKALLDSNAFRP